jgi:hypothetical protein
MNENAPDGGHIALRPVFVIDEDSCEKSLQTPESDSYINSSASSFVSFGGEQFMSRQ